MQLRVWHVPNMPGKPFLVHVQSLAEGRRLLEILSNYDLFQFDNDIKPDYANLSGLAEYDEHADGWIEWCDCKTGQSVDELSLERMNELDAQAKSNNGSVG